MKQFTQRFGMTFLILSITTFSCMSQISGTNTVLNISANTPTVVDAGLTLTGTDDITTVTIQITNGYISGSSGDILSYNGSLPSGITPIYDNTYGIMRLLGTASPSVWQTFLRTITLQTTSATCYSEKRSVTFVLGNKLYNPSNGHFYVDRDVWDSWSASKLAAESTSYYGRKGYLATITSQDENNFIYNITAYNGTYNPWLGASDDYLLCNEVKGAALYANQAASDGNFYWVSGPESGTQFSTKNTWESGGTSSVSGRFMSWSSGEPNDNPNLTSASPGEENYVQYLAGSAQWNDADGGSSKSIIEYGDMPGDAITNNVAHSTRNIFITGASAGTVTSNNNNVCPGSNNTTLTLSGLTGSVVRWESSNNRYFSNPAVISNTTGSLNVVNITETTYYRAIVNSTSPQTCSNLASSITEIKVASNIPGNIIPASNQICTGGDAILTLYGHQGTIIKWQSATNITFTSGVIDLNSPTNFILDRQPTAGTFYYRAQVNNNSCGNAFTEALRIDVISGTPNNGGVLNNNIALCGSTNSGTLTLFGYTGNIQKWQSSTDYGIAWSDISSTSNPLNFSGLTSNTTFRAVVGSGTCPSSNSNAINVYLNNQDGTWTGNAGSDWTNSANWCGNVPTLVTDVLIPAGRISPNIDNNGTCRNLSFGEGATLTFTTGKKLEIAGAISGIDAIDASTGEIVMKGSTEQTLPASAFNFNAIQNLTIDNSGAGGVTLSGNLTITGGTGGSTGLKFTTGLINTNASNLLIIGDKALTTGSGNNLYVNGPLRKIGKDAFIFPIGKKGKYAPCEISGASQDNSEFTAEYFKNPFSVLAMDASLQSVSGKEYWNIDRSNSTAVEVSLYYMDATFSGIVSATSARLRVAHFNTGGQNWEDLSSGTIIPSVSGGNKVTLTNVNSFSPFTFGSPNGFNPLPLTLIHFVAIPDNNAKTVELKWETVSEENNKYFDVMHSTDFVHWTSIGRINSMGSGNQVNNYSFNHSTPSVINHYKLKEVSIDGDITYSDTKLARFAEMGAEIIIYPNPSSGSITITNASEETNYDITDLTGRIIKSGIFSQTIEIQNLPKGVYIVNLVSEGVIRNEKIIIQ